jgi:hypothetical protein
VPADQLGKRALVPPGRKTFEELAVGPVGGRRPGSEAFKEPLHAGIMTGRAAARAKIVAERGA